jgi:uncharacterized membrane protein
VFLWQDGVMTDVTADSGAFGPAQAFNERGQILLPGNDFRTFVWRAGVTTLVPTLPNNAFPLDISDTGDLTGVGVLANGDNHALVWRQVACDE